jgi:hypothetical protein
VSGEISLPEAGRLMTVFGLARIRVFERGMMAGTLGFEDVTRGLRRPDRNLSALLARDPLASSTDPLPSGATVAEPPPGFEERAPLFEPDVLLPSQYFDRVRRSAEYESERRLMVAVLEQGVNDYLKNLDARDPRQQELWREAEAWVEDRDPRWIFSFENICHVLAIEPEYLRRGLHACRERARGGREETVAAAPEGEQERARATSG